MKKIPIKRLLIPGLLIIALATAYYPTLLWLCERFVATDSYYSHGFLVPLVVGYLIWAKKQELIKEIPHCNRTGLWLVLAALGGNALSLFVGVYFVSGLSLLLLAFGLTLYFFGSSITRKVAVPLLFLLFMVPLPLSAINAISFPMRMYATKVSVFLVHHLSGINVHSEGFQIILPNGMLTVGLPCSGLRSLIAMLALGGFIAYRMEGNIFRRILLLIIAVPIALASNILRIMLLTFGAYRCGPGIMEGGFHDVTGYLMFVFAFATLWYFRKVLTCQPKYR